jgi:predicted RecB family nuclease
MLIDKKLAYFNTLGEETQKRMIHYDNIDIKTIEDQPPHIQRIMENSQSAIFKEAKNLKGSLLPFLEESRKS